MKLKTAFLITYSVFFFFNLFIFINSFRSLPSCIDASVTESISDYLYITSTHAIFLLHDKNFISRNRYNKEKVARTINLHLPLLFSYAEELNWKRVNLWCCTIKLTHFTIYGTKNGMNDATCVYRERRMRYLAEENKTRFVLWQSLCIHMLFFVINPEL